MSSAASPLPDPGFSPKPPEKPDPGPVFRESRDECIHCGLSLGAHHRPEDGPFCCRGCKTVYELINAEGLGRYYELRRCSTSPPGELRRESMAWLDPLLAAAPKLPGSSVRRLRLDVQGVHCAACVWLLEQLFARHVAGKHLRINPAVGVVDLAWDPEEGDLADYLAEVEPFGYRFGPARKEAPRRSRQLMVRMGICIAIALNVMMFTLSYYLGLAPSDGAVYVLFGRLNLALATVSVVVGGWPFAHAAWYGLRRRLVHLDLPIALGMGLAYLGSTYAYFSHGPEAAYFDTIAIFVALMLVGRWLQERVLERNRNAVLASGGVSDLYARRFSDKSLQTVSASELRSGDLLWIAPGDLVPVRGVLLHRSARVSLDWITGEAAPLSCDPGEEIPSGAFNADDQGFRITAVEDFSSSRLNDLVSVESPAQGDEAGSRSVGSSWWHRVSTVYVISVLTLALLGFVLWSGSGMRKAVEVSVAILVVTCPCALGLAVPLGRELAHVALRRQGVLLRRGSFLERALQVRHVVFDKTGTLTRGQLSLTAESRRTLLAIPARERSVLWNMTSRSTHPVSRCVSAALRLVPVDEAVENGAPWTVLENADTVVEEAGYGLRWHDADHEYRFGRPRFALGDDPAARVGATGTGVAAQAAFSRDGQLVAHFDFDEEIRRDARAEVALLEALGYEVHLLSGDTTEKVRAVAEAVGIDKANAVGQLSPESKADTLRRIDHHDTLMVGDGLNDSLSFDAALCSATPAVDRAILPQKADFYFLGDGTSAVRHSLLTALRLRSVQKDNLVFAAAYNALAVGLCLCGLVSPVVAAILMPLSSLTVVALTSTRMGRGKSAWTS